MIDDGTSYLLLEWYFPTFWFLLMRDQVLAPGLPRPALCGPSAAKCLDPFDQKGTSIEILFMFLADHDSYTKTTDVEFDVQVTALSCPQACLGHLNHHEKPLISDLKNKKRSTICLTYFQKTYILY